MKVYPLVLSILFICIGPALASPAAPSSTHEPVIQHGFHALVFSKTVGFRHDSIPTGIQAIQNLGLAHDFEVTATEDASVFSEQGLAGFDVIIFLNTTGDVLSDDQQEAMEGFLESGKGFVGIHSAADTEYDWGWYEQVVGAFFDNHPAIQQAELFVEDRVHPATAHLPARWDRTDEWYAFRSNPGAMSTCSFPLTRTATRAAQWARTIHGPGAAKSVAVALFTPMEVTHRIASQSRLSWTTCWAASSGPRA